MLRYTPVVSPHETESLHPTRDSCSKNSSAIEELIIDSIWFMGNSTKILELTRNQHPLLNGLKLATFNSDWTSVLDTEEDGDWRRVGRSDTTNRWGETAFGCEQKAKNHLSDTRLKIHMEHKQTVWFGWFSFANGCEELRFSVSGVWRYPNFLQILGPIWRVF